jgi:hypothetical protein
MSAKSIDQQNIRSYINVESSYVGFGTLSGVECWKQVFLISNVGFGENDQQYSILVSDIE